MQIPSGAESLEKAFSLLRLLSSTEKPDRQRYLEEACRLTGDFRAKAFLWLYDESKDRLNLDRIFPLDDDSAFKRRFAHLANSSLTVAVDQGAAVSPWPISMDPDLEKRFATGNNVFLPLLWSSCPETKKWLGYLHLLTARPLQDDQKMILEILANALTTVIHRSRQKRRLDALEKVGKHIPLHKDKRELLATAAHTVKDIMQAGACIIFQHEKNLGVQAVASTLPGSLDNLKAGPDSIITKILNDNQEGVRLDDLHDEEERAKVFSTAKMDRALSDLIESPDRLNARQRGWMAAPVMLEEHAVAVIVIYNKTKGLSEGFSKTDEEILQRVCKFLSDVIPGIETLQAMQTISKKISPGALKTETQRNSLYNLLSDQIPGVACVAISPGMDTPLRPFGGETWLEKVPRPQRGSDIAKKVERVVHGGNDGERWIIDFDIPSELDADDGQQDEPRCLLRIGLKRMHLSQYEREIITFFCAELGQELRLEASIEKELNHLLEVRHAIRSGLEGMSYIQTALGIFNRFQQTNDLSELDRPRFRRALTRAHTYYQKTRILLEEARFITTDITPEKLRPGSHSIKELVQEVCTCLQPEAEKRDITVNPLVMRLPQGMQDNFMFDRGLLEIALFNLVDNAIKYSFREEHVSLRLELDRECWRLSVENIGVHIPEKDIDVIFEEFVRRPGGQRGLARPGTGLGLTVVDKIIKAHGGPRPEVSSHLVHRNRGPDAPARTMFAIRIPRRLSSP